MSAMMIARGRASSEARTRVSGERDLVLPARPIPEAARRGDRATPQTAQRLNPQSRTTPVRRRRERGVANRSLYRARARLDSAAAGGGAQHVRSMLPLTHTRRVDSYTSSTVQRGDNSMRCTRYCAVGQPPNMRKEETLWPTGCAHRLCPPAVQHQIGGPAHVRDTNR